MIVMNTECETIREAQAVCRNSTADRARIWGSVVVVEYTIERRRRRMTDNQFVTKLKTRMKNIASERDKLRNMMSTARDLAEVCDRAVEDIENAIESLSELV